MKGVKGKWALEVCRTCGRRAIWPFCEHREQPPPNGTPSWYETVAVTGVWHPATTEEPSGT